VRSRRDGIHRSDKMNGHANCAAPLAVPSPSNDLTRIVIVAAQTTVLSFLREKTI